MEILAMFKKIVIPIFALLFYSFNSFAANSLSNDQIKTISENAVIFGYPLLLMDITEKVATNVPAPTNKGLAPVNQLSRMRIFPDYNFKEVVRANLDTLYVNGWFDLSKEPMILSVPDMGDRYFMLPLLDAWTEVFASPGTRTMKSGAKNIMLTGPDWQGKAPKDVTVINAPTNTVWMIGRILTKGEKDYDAVHAIQDKITVTSLSNWGQEKQTPQPEKVNSNIDMKSAPVFQVEKMDSVTFFENLATKMKKNPPHKGDKAMMQDLAKIGIVPGKDFDKSQFSQEQLKTLEAGKKAALEKIMAFKNIDSIQTNGWDYNITNMGKYDDNYLNRAYVAYIGLGANLPEDAIYPMTFATAEGKKLESNNQYVLHFDKDNMPPVKAFWSLTLYNKDGFLAENAINKYLVRDRDPLKFNDDGSLDIYIQQQSPGENKESNWLPTPKSGTFNLILRFYWPEKPILEGKYQIPAVKQAK